MGIAFQIKYNTMHKPIFSRKRFGQHFLHNAYVLAKIANSIAAEKTEHIIEIGPGKGALTQYLAGQCFRLDLIEIDRDLAAFLERKYDQYPSVHIHTCDALRFPFNEYLLNANYSMRIVGNLPYNIATPLIFKLFDINNKIQDMHFMLQKEVALRLTARVNSPHYSRLSVMSQYFCDNQILFFSSPSDFIPQPKVDSAFIKLIPKQAKITQAKELTHFRKIVKEAFTYRRKTLSNSLKMIISAAELRKLNIDAQLRPQDLTVSDFVNISNQYTARTDAVFHHHD